MLGLASGLGSGLASGLALGLGAPPKLRRTTGRMVAAGRLRGTPRGCTAGKQAAGVSWVGVFGVGLGLGLELG